MGLRLAGVADGSSPSLSVSWYELWYVLFKLFVFIELLAEREATVLTAKDLVLVRKDGPVQCRGIFPWGWGRGGN